MLQTKMNRKKVIKKKQVQDVVEAPNLIRYMVQRFKLNDPTSPTYYMIGFKLVCDLNQRDCYVETQLDYKDCKDKSDNEICVIAYNKLKSKITEVSKELLLKKFIVGSEFVPPR